MHLRKPLDEYDSMSPNVILDVQIVQLFKNFHFLGVYGIACLGVIFYQSLRFLTWRDHHKRSY